MLKVISSSIFAAFFMVLCFSSLHAQGNNNSSTSNYDLMIDDASAIIILCSQTSGDVQQLIAFSNNGNANQLASRIDDINSGIASLTDLSELLASRPIITRAISAEVSRLVDATGGSRYDWRQITTAINSNNAAAVEVLGSQMRTGLQTLKGIGQEIRAEVTVAKNAR